MKFGSQLKYEMRTVIINIKLHIIKITELNHDSTSSKYCIWEPRSQKLIHWAW